MLEVEALEARRGRRALFTDLAFAAQPGQLVRLTGANGAGKTTLLRMLVGLATPTQGQVRWRGALIAAQRDEFHRQLVWCGHAASLKDDASAIENLRVAAALAGDAIQASAARQALGEAGLAGRDHLPARVLSAGQRRRVGLARLLLAAHRPLWVLDEPFNTPAPTRWREPLTDRMERPDQAGPGARGRVTTATPARLDFSAAEAPVKALQARCPQAAWSVLTGGTVETRAPTRASVDAMRKRALSAMF
ncbi:MAG: heme ABC exporter ATP-binding protein CcmA [Methylibium petroleiphilum]|nr:heme ABC exporter ATP-binding protein CcmA [Methylibium petroleiphilum]